MSDIPEINVSSLPHQVEESDRLSLFGMVRLVGLIVVLCALVQVVCGILPFKFHDPVWTLANSAKWNGPACLFLLGGLLFFIPGPTGIRLGSPAPRFLLRGFLGLLGLSYLVLAGVLIQATSVRLDQLHESDQKGRAEREMAFQELTRQIQTSASREDLDRLLTNGQVPPLKEKPAEDIEDYRRQVIAHFRRENDATVASFKTFVVDEEITANRITFFRKIIRSSTFGMALLVLAWLAPKGFPAPRNLNEQPA